MKDVREIALGLENAGYPLEGVATAGQPEQEHLERLAEAGYRTVLDVRTLGEDPQASTKQKPSVTRAWST